MQFPLVCSVVVNWNLKEELRDCLDSLLMSNYPNHKIVVVDNGSTDNSVSFIVNKYQDIQLMALKENQGYAAGLNEGIRWSLQQGCDYIFALNNDVILEKETISRVVRILNEHPDIAIVTPKVKIFGKDKLFGLGDRRYWWLPLPMGYGYGKPDHPKYQGLMDFDYVPGCAMMIRSSVFKKVGCFDTSYFMYYEDADFCRRTRESGYRIVCCCDTVIYHKVGKSSNKNRQYLIQIRARNRVLFFRKYRHGLHPCFTYILLWILAFWSTIRFLVKGNYGAMYNYWRGFLNGWR